MFFSILCCDIIEHSRPAANEAEALELVISRYKQWSKLLETQRSGLMDEQRRKGLLGELLFLEQRISSADSVLSAVQGWSGADGADQDFIYPDGWFEVKSIGVSAVSVMISSLEQLDCADAGELVINRIDKAAPDKAGAVSLNDVVRRMSASLIVNSDALDLFRTKLSQYGYIDLQEYSEQKYYCSGTQRYRIDESFPRLTSDNVPTQVIALHYEIGSAVFDRLAEGVRSMDAQEFRKDFLEDIKADALAAGEGSCASFVTAFARYLQEAEIPTGLHIVLLRRNRQAESQAPC